MLGCFRAAVVLFIFSSSFTLAAEELKASAENPSPTELLVEVRAVSSRSIAVKPVDLANFEKISLGKIYSTNEGLRLKANGKRDGLVAMFWDGPTGSLTKGDIVKLIIPTEEDTASEFLRQQESREEALLAPPNRKKFMDIDFFHDAGEISLAADNEIIITDSTSVAVTSGTASGELKTSGITSSLKLTAGIFPRISIYGKFNYVSKKTKTTTNNSPEKESKFSGIDDPEVGASFRLHERDHENDFTSTVTLSFQPSLHEPEFEPNGQTKPGLGYTISTLSAPFAWRRDKLEFSVGPHFALLGKGGWDGVNGRKSGNHDPAFIFAVEGKTQYSVSRNFRLGGSLGIVFPHTRESEQLFSPVVREEDEYPFMLRLSLDPQLSLNSQGTFILATSINGLVATEKLEATLRQGNTTVNAKANTDTWTCHLGLKYLF